MFLCSCKIIKGYYNLLTRGASVDAVWVGCVAVQPTQHPDWPHAKYLNG